MLSHLVNRAAKQHTHTHTHSAQLHVRASRFNQLPIIDKLELLCIGIGIVDRRRHIFNSSEPKTNNYYGFVSQGVDICLSVGLADDRLSNNHKLMCALQCHNQPGR